MSQTSKTATFANLTSDSTDMNSLAYTQAGFVVDFKIGSTSNAFSGAAEWQTSTYVSAPSNTLMTKVNAEDFSNAIYTGATSTYTTLVAAKSNYSCSTTPDYIASMDFSKSALAAIAAKCENKFSNMQFCDSSVVQQAENIVFTSQSSLFGSCATTYCNDGDDFACQRWADNNRSNSQGLTTANAQCKSGCCGIR
jgi:hypothetical protein